MSSRRITALALCLGVAAALLMLARASPGAAEPGGEPDRLSFRNATGRASTLSTTGEVDPDNPFFQDLGTNGRRCVTCHQPAQGWSITPAGAQARFTATGGTDALFRNNDGSNCEGALHATRAEEWNQYSLLLTRGLIRVGLDVPAGAEFVIDGVTDPYACTPPTNDLSAYRRPLPATNLRFLSAVMWDGRESSTATTIRQDLMTQANDATRGHAQAFRDLTAAERRQIVDFETGLYTAQITDDAAGPLQSHGAQGGPEPLAAQRFFIGINDPVGLNPTGAPFDQHAFTIFAGWKSLPGSSNSSPARARETVARGEAIFNTRTFTVSGVAGLNNETFASGVTVPASFTSTCTVCHDSPNAGNHSVKAPLDIGITRPSVAPYLPVYRLRNITTGDTVDTTDPGRAMITGRWRDVNRFKGPVLRALAARPPYFHNGSAATLREVVEFYNTRFSIGLSGQEKSDLEAFLRSL